MALPPFHFWRFNHATGAPAEPIAGNPATMVYPDEGTADRWPDAFLFRLEAFIAWDPSQARVISSPAGNALELVAPCSLELHVDATDVEASGDFTIMGCVRSFNRAGGIPADDKDFFTAVIDTADIRGFMRADSFSALTLPWPTTETIAPGDGSQWTGAEWFVFGIRGVRDAEDGSYTLQAFWKGEDGVVRWGPVSADSLNNEGTAVLPADGARVDIAFTLWRAAMLEEFDHAAAWLAYCEGAVSDEDIESSAVTVNGLIGGSEPGVVDLSGTGTAQLVGTGMLVAVEAGSYALDVSSIVGFDPPIGANLRLIGVTSLLACWVTVTNKDGSILYVADAQQPGDATLFAVAEAEASGSVEIRHY